VSLAGASSEAVRRHLDALTKPPGSLGHLEELAVRLGGLLGDPPPPLAPRVILVMAGDHGVTAAGVSRYPSDVTRQMCLNMAAGGAAVNVLGRLVDARVVVVDVGVGGEEPVGAGVLHRRVRGGTRDLSKEPALTPAEVEAALQTGAGIVEELSPRPGILVLGEMGIGNSTVAAALASALLGLDPVESAGPGTGVTSEGRQRKVRAIRAGVERLHAVREGDDRNESEGSDEAVDPSPDRALALDALAHCGGLEIAGLAGAALEAGRQGIPVVLDGFISSVAGLVSSRLNPEVDPWLFASHVSAEPGHPAVLSALGLRPLLSLELRLGEGTGGALALPILEAAGAILREMATFDSAGVSGPSTGESSGEVA
jgi:nicotinate-nucleotide--dimethylbenzimidazole phosphoribosyltransferase